LVLSKKSENLTETELGIIKYWLKWQNKSKWFNDVRISRSKDFSIDDLSQSLENAVMADGLIPEIIYKKEMMKVIAKRMLPDLADEKLLDVYTAIDKLTEKDVGLGDEPDGIATPKKLGVKDIRQEIELKARADNFKLKEASSFETPKVEKV